MGNSFGYLHNEGGFQFTVVKACKAAGIDLNQTCSLAFDSNHGLVSIGNVTKGHLEARPGIAGVGIWYAMMVFFGVIVIAFVFIVLEGLSRSTALTSSPFAWFKDTPVQDPNNPGAVKRSVFRAAGRTFVLGVSDTQTIFVGAFLLGFAGQSKCQLTSYHFTVAVNQMMIALSVMTFSVALVRTYWRNPLAAAFRLLLSFGAFLGVGLTIFRKANYGPDWPPPHSRKDSAILLPVACLLESSLRTRAQDQAKQSQTELGFGKSSTWPVERYFFISLAIAFTLAHISVPIRHVKRKGYAADTWTKTRTLLTVLYWFYMLVPPTFTSIWCWVRVYQTREWVNRSGWIGAPNPEMIIWDQGQLFAMGVLVTVIMNMLTEALRREGKDAGRPASDAFQRLSAGSGVGFEERRADAYPLVNRGSGVETGYHGYQGYQQAPRW